MTLINPCNAQTLNGEKKRLTTIVDGVEREYFLHIPASYSENSAVPLVFMLHGTGGDGDKMYVGSGWAELAESENFIAVFPSSMRYKIDDGGELKNITKWNHTPDAEWTFQPGETGKDDIKFLRRVVNEVVGAYNIDAQRIYLNGFSNGGSMAAKCAVEMSDILAAVAANASSFYKDTTYIPKRNIPVIYQVGNKDYGPGNEGPEIPLIYFDSLISTPNLPIRNGKFYRIANNYTNNFNYAKEHTTTGDTNSILIASYLPIEADANREFRYIFVKGLEHNYPNWAPTQHWNWMKKYTLDNTQVGGVSNLNSIEGYGSGQYELDEVVHIWAKQIDGKVFTHWSGDVQYLDSPHDDVRQY